MLGIFCSSTIYVYPVISKLLKNLPPESVNVADNNGWTPLTAACKFGNKRVVEVLLKYNADLTINHGQSPLHLAACNKNQSVIKFLVDKCPTMVNLKINPAHLRSLMTRFS